MTGGYRIKPVWKKPDEELEAKVSDQVRSEIEKIKTELESKADERIKAILKEKEESTRKEKADKIQEAINAAKSIKEDKEKGKEGTVATVEQSGDKGHNHDDILCPTCKGGHVHKATDDKSGLVYKCTKDGCGFVSVMVRKDSDYKCNGCGAPIKKPEKPEDMDGCPFCGGTKAVKHDWSKVWGVVKK